MTPRRLYSIIATAEMITWALLLLGITLKYSSVTPLGVRIAGPIHGFTFLTYGAITVLLWINNKWSAARLIVGLLSAVVPFATLPFERNAEKAGLLNGPWRYRDTAEQPSGLLDTCLAFVVRRPILAAVLILVLLAVIFFILLSLGSPLEAVKK